jgi:hypothetical protein
MMTWYVANLAHIVITIWLLLLLLLWTILDVMAWYVAYLTDIIAFGHIRHLCTLCILSPEECTVLTVWLLSFVAK